MVMSTPPWWGSEVCTWSHAHHNIAPPHPCCPAEHVHWSQPRLCWTENRVGSSADAATALINHWTGACATQLPPNAVHDQVASLCGEDDTKKAVVKALSERLKAGGEGAFRALVFLIHVAKDDLAGMHDSLKTLADSVVDPNWPYFMAGIGAQSFLEQAASAKEEAAAAKATFEWNIFRSMVGRDLRCGWAPPPCHPRFDMPPAWPAEWKPNAPEGYQALLIPKAALCHATNPYGYPLMPWG